MASQGDSEFRKKLAAYNRLVAMNQMSKRLDEDPYNPVTDGPRRPLRKYEAMQEWEKMLPDNDTALHTLYAGKYIQRGLAEAYADPSAYTPYAKRPSFLQELFSLGGRPKPDESFTSKGLRALGKKNRRTDNMMRDMYGITAQPPEIPYSVFQDRRKKKKPYSMLGDPSVEQVPR